MSKYPAYDTMEITIKCNRTASENLIKMLKHMENLGCLGCTRDFKIGEDFDEWFTWDGDGPDKIEDIQVKCLKEYET